MRAKIICDDANSLYGYQIECPGCGLSHLMPVVGPHRWAFNGDLERPTFSPSILMRSGHYARQFKPGEDACWCTYNAEHPDQPAPFTCVICHSFVRDGRIQFLGDCTHALASQTVDLPDIEDAA